MKMYIKFVQTLTAFLRELFVDFEILKIKFILFMFTGFIFLFTQCS